MKTLTAILVLFAAVTCRGEPPTLTNMFVGIPADGPTNNLASVFHMTNNWIDLGVSNRCTITYDVKIVCENLQTSKQTEEMVRELAKRGDICKVFGHNWRDGRPGEGNGMTFADYHPGTVFRTCAICGTCQSQSLNDWK